MILAKTYRLLVVFVVTLLVTAPTLLSQNIPADSNLNTPAADTNALPITATDTISVDSNSQISSEPLLGATPAVDTTRTLMPNQLNAWFTQERIELNKGQIISNVLVLNNNTPDSITVRADVLFPMGWNSLTNTSAVSLLPNEQKIIPVTLLPKSLTNNNTEILINVFLTNNEEEQMAHAYFTLYTKKQISWDVKALEGNRMYLKNDEVSKTFNFSIMNTGNFKQDILVQTDMNQAQLTLKDSNNLPISGIESTIQLLPGHDTVLQINTEINDDKNRNFRKRSIQNYNPNSRLTYRKHTLFLHTKETKGFGKDIYRKDNKVDLIRLPNSKKVSTFGYPNLPVIMEAQIQNVLSEFTFMSLNLRGFKQLNQDASLSYFAQFNYNQAYWNTDQYRTTPWYIGYFDKNKSIEVGQVSGNLIGTYNFGMGIKGSYKYFGNHKTTGFYVRSPRLFSTPITESFGLGHQVILNKSIKVEAKAGRGTNYASNTQIDVASLNPTFNINRKHFINLFGAISNRSLIDNTIVPAVQGYMVGLNYTTHFADKKIRTNIGGRYNGPNFSYGANERLSVNHRSTLNVGRNLDVYVNNNYQSMTSFAGAGIVGFNQRLFFNNIVLSTVKKVGTIQPGVYYNINEYQNNNVHARGLQFRYSNFNYVKNLLTTVFVKAGYNDPIDLPNSPDYFNMELSSLIRYKVWNLSLRYNYGALSNMGLIQMQNEQVTPQSFRASVQNQFQFKNPHFIAENSFIYNYNNRFDGHNVGIAPRLFYFTNSGWRYGVQMNYNFSSSDYSSIYESYTNNFTASRGATTNTNFNVAVNVRKEFGVPIPFAKKRHATNSLVAFYDVNGNGVKESDEPSMENIVIRIDGQEVITNKKGMAELANMPIGKYPMTIIALEKMDGWFPSTSDSITILNNGQIFVPFVRGVKVYGDVILDRQKIAIADKDKVVDLSRIKIMAVGGKTYTTLTDIDGHFEFYLPNGDYTLTMDESILGETYQLSRNNIPLQLTPSQEALYMSFYIIEKRRKVNIKTF